MSRIKKIKEKKTIVQEFKEFALRGNMVDLAVGVVIGAAFNSIIQSLVNDIIMPLVGVVALGDKFKGFKYDLGNDQVLAYGAFIQNIINFFIIALAVFLVIKVINKLRSSKEDAAAPIPLTEAELLTEIRDLLKEKS